MTDPERLTESDLLGALHDAADEPVTVGSLDLTDLRRNILNELSNRLGDPELAKDIPGTGLIQLAKELLKAAAPKPGEDLPVVPDPDVLELASQPGFPRERRIELLTEELGRARERVARIEEALEAE